MSPQVGELDEDAFGTLLAADPDAAAALVSDLALATDRDLRAAAQRLAARVFVRVGRVGRTRTQGARRLVAQRSGDGDLDLDRTLERWTGATPVAAEDLVTRGWTGHRRAVCLAVDSSGSMSGLAVAIAAVAAAGVVLRRDERLETSVLSFGREVEVVAGHARRPAAEDGRAPAARAARARADRRGRGTAGRPGRAAVRGRRPAGRRAALGLPAHHRRPARSRRWPASTGCTCCARCRRPSPRRRRGRWPPAAAARPGWSTRSGT